MTLNSSPQINCWKSRRLPVWETFALSTFFSFNWSTSGAWSGSAIAISIKQNIVKKQLHNNYITSFNEMLSTFLQQFWVSSGLRPLRFSNNSRCVVQHLEWTWSWESRSRLESWYLFSKTHSPNFSRETVGVTARHTNRPVKLYIGLRLSRI